MSLENLKITEKEDLFEDVKCNICFQLNLEPLTYLGCKHTLCDGCTGRWLAKVNQCPMCRTQVEEIQLNEELKKRAHEYLQKHPEANLAQDLKYEHNAYETIFWSIQLRKNDDDKDIVFYGEKPTTSETRSEEDRKRITRDIRHFRIKERLEIVREQLGANIPFFQQQHNQNIFDKIFYQNDVTYEDEDQQWRMIDGRGLVRVPRSTNRNYCPIRFRRSHST